MKFQSYNTSLYKNIFFNQVLLIKDRIEWYIYIKLYRASFKEERFKKFLEILLTERLKCIIISL